MGDISNKADELAGRAKEAAGDLTGNDELQAEGTVDKVEAQVKQGAQAVADKAEETAEVVTDKAQAVAEKVDSRVVIAAVAGLAVVLALVVRRNRATSRQQKHPVAKKVVAAGITRALTH